MAETLAQAYRYWLGVGAGWGDVMWGRTDRASFLDALRSVDVDPDFETVCCENGDVLKVCSRWFAIGDNPPK